MQIRSLSKNPLFLISLFYFITRLTNLLTLPIFNDEAIYIDWGMKETNLKGFLFYSLYDGKPPLLMWIFGLFHKLIADPLLAARIVSVLAGFITLIGIYKLSETYFKRTTAIFASILYIIIPLFGFFDRQALMESAVSAVGIWSLILLLRLPEDKTVKNVILLGLTWATGIFIKQTALVFILVEISVFSWITFKNKDRKSSLNLILSLIVFQIALLPLYFQEKFWATLSENSRFTLSLGEIISFPVSIWFKNLIGIFSISLWYLGPVILILALAGIWLSMSENYNHKSIPLVFLFSLLIILISFRTISPRYLASFLPLSTLFSAIAINRLFRSIKYKFATLFVAMLFPLILTTLLLLNPLNYFSFLGRLTPYSQEEGYVSGWTSGYATREAIEYLKTLTKKTPAIIAVRVDAGNPESAVFAYFNFSEKTRVAYFDSRFIDQNIFKYDCLTTNTAFYFVARDTNLAGMSKYLEGGKVFYNPPRNNSVGIYKLKEACKGKTINLQI